MGSRGGSGDGPGRAFGLCPRSRSIPETEPVRTSACLEVWEQDLASTDGSSNGAGDELASFNAVFAAIKRQDHDALLQLSDPRLGRDPKLFEEQSKAYFLQFQKIDLLGVNHIFELDGLIVFLAQLRSGESTIIAPFVFTRGNGSGDGFLPYRTDLLTYKLLEDWLYTPWGSINSKSPAYCPAAAVERANYRFAPSPPAQGKKESHPSFVLLRGAPMEHPGDLRNATAQVQAAFEALDANLATDNIEGFFSLLPASTVKRVRTGYLASTAGDREKFREAIKQQKPFFVFDASPLLIAYTKAPDGAVQVMYFTFNEQNKLIWTNAYKVTLIDKLFKKGVLYDASQLHVPFSNAVRN